MIVKNHTSIGLLMLGSRQTFEGHEKLGPEHAHCINNGLQQIWKCHCISTVENQNPIIGFK